MCESHIGRVAASRAGHRTTLRSGLATYFESSTADPKLPDSGPMEPLSQAEGAARAVSAGRSFRGH